MLYFWIINYYFHTELKTFLIMNDLYKVFIVLMLFILVSCSSRYATEGLDHIKISLTSNENVINGSENWQGPEDCSAQTSLYRHPEGLLIHVNVVDDQVSTHIDETIYQNDGIELYFDLRPYRLNTKKKYTPGVFQLTIVPGIGQADTDRINFYPAYYHAEVPGTEVISELTNEGYFIEVFLPYQGLSENHYLPGNQFKFDFAVNDADKEKRETVMIWAGKHDNWKNPNNFARVSFK